VRLAAPETPVYSFGARHVHPAIAPVVERAALIAGLDGISHVAAGRQLGVDPVGTMPHALLLCFGRDAQPAAWVAFDEAVDDAVPRIALCDTFDDEVTEVRAAVETLGERLEAVRLDTTHSRRHLDQLGASDVDIFVSGGLGPAELTDLAPHVDAFGVGGAITGARPLDIALDLVAVDGAAVSKRGKLPGVKQLYRHDDGTHTVVPADAPAPAGATPLLEPLLVDGTPTDLALGWEAAAERCAADVRAVGLDAEQLRR
jgi:nicotinate phosphoribosyltransferase